MRHRIRIRPRPGRSLATAAASAACIVAAIAPAPASAATAYCDEPVSQAFSAFGDSNLYALAPSGDFESAALDGWTLTGGAARVAGSESYNVTGVAGAYSMNVPATAQVTSAEVCVDPTRETFRFFVRPSKSDARVRVEALFTRSGQSKATVANVGWVSGRAGTWQPSPILRNDAARYLPAGTTGTVRYRFTADKGAVQVDDLHIDPRRIRKV